MPSLLAKDVKQALSKAFPNSLIKEEEYISYKGQKLFFDFFLPSLKICIEVQGIQHTEFNKHFHGTAANFRASKRRDALKSEWCDLNDFSLVTINYDEIPICSDRLLEKIIEVQNG